MSTTVVVHYVWSCNEILAVSKWSWRSFPSQIWDMRNHRARCIKTFGWVHVLNKALWLLHLVTFNPVCLYPNNHSITVAPPSSSSPAVPRLVVAPPARTRWCRISWSPRMEKLSSLPQETASTSGTSESKKIHLCSCWRAERFATVRVVWVMLVIKIKTLFSIVI